MNNEEKSEFFIQQLHEILLKDWDPIGVSKNKDAEDEYDYYIEDILDLLGEETTTEKEILELLLYIEHEDMQLKSNVNKVTLVAEKIWKAFENFIS